ncbi:MAG: glycosyltransferase [Flavobacterium sp.]|nr:glycosyltransferase [Flavobacterium sp.]
MILCCFLLFITYLFVILSLYGGFLKVKTFEITNRNPETKFTIIVPFRNEADNLPQLLNSFSNLDYPVNLFEVILVDDGSEDRFGLQTTDYRLQTVPNNRVSNSPKKDAILTAINLAKTDWIITTDADCVVNPDWLLGFDNFIHQNNAEMVAGAVAYHGSKSFLYAFQQLDMASLQGATIGSFGIGKAFMCNGANFAYTKSLFEKLDGFAGNTDFAGGDDVFLLQKAISQFPEKVHYLKSANVIVHTKPENSWRKLFFQRVRWASKASGYKSGFAKFLGLVVFGVNFMWVLGFGFWVLGFWNTFLFFVFTTLKFAADYLLIAETNTFLGHKTRQFLLGSLLYPFFSTAVVLYSLFGEFEWKDRKFRK